MTTNRSFLPELSCPHCDFVGTGYKIEHVNVHTKASCPNCESYIKMLSKDDKWRVKEKDRVIWDKTGGRCGYCGEKLNPFLEKGYTRDHMIPRSRGGDNSIENLLPSCTHCNSQKKDKTVNEYRKWIKEKDNLRHKIFYFEVCEYGPSLLKNILRKLL